MRLEGKRCIVTGASKGIGRAIATRFAAEGARVLATARSSPQPPLAEDILFLPGDVADPGHGPRLVAACRDAFGGIDVLVNNAGVARDGLFVRLKDEDWREVIAVNLTAGFRLARAALRGMMRARWGRIVSITSIVGQTGNPGQANYAAAKAGITGMTKSLAAEVAGRGVTVNCVAPGFIDTAMTRGLADDQAAALAGRIPAGRFGAPEDVAACVVFLASAEAGYVTGQTLSVNGGMAMI